jgi:hypothetical protein
MVGHLSFFLGGAEVKKKREPSYAANIRVFKEDVRMIV